MTSYGGSWVAATLAAIVLAGSLEAAQQPVESLAASNPASFELVVLGDHLVLTGRKPLPEPRSMNVSLDLGPTASLSQATNRSAWSSLRLRQGTIEGQVSDASSLAPLSTTQVHIPALGMGTISGVDGSYRLSDVPAGTHVLVAERIGYESQSQEISVGDGVTVSVDFALRRQALALDEVVVTGTPGGSQRRALGNVVSQIDASSIENRPVTRLEHAIGSSVPGVRMMAPTGAAGGEMSIRVRGSSSLALSGDPLIYVDGVRLNARRAFDGRGSATSRLQDIDPSMIESIEIIKGPAAATLYGTEASNGVIQIITKRGESGAAVFESSVELGANWQPDPTRNFGLHWYRDSATGEFRSHNFYELEQSPDRFGKPLFQYGPIQRYNGSVRGGSDLFRYYAAVNRTSEEGFSRGDWTKGWRVQTSLTAVPREGLSLTVHSSRSVRDTRDLGSVMCSYACWANPVTVDRPQRGAGRPYESLLAGQTDIRSSNRFSWSAELSHNPATWFSHRLVGGVDDSGIERVQFTPRGANGFEQFWGVAGRDGQKQIWTVDTPTRTLDYSATLTLPVTDQLQSSTSWGLQWFNRQEREVWVLGSNFAVPALATVGAAADRDSRETYVENTTVGTFIQNEFSWENRLFFTGAVRFDDHSAFGTDFDAAIYPKVSGSWVLSEEEFFPEEVLGVDLSQFRIRGAWGQSGMQPDAFAAQRLYRPETGPQTQPVLTREAFGNPDLGPETGSELEVGFDAGMLSDRLSLGFTYYNRVTKDAIVARPVRSSVGFPGTQFLNIGQTSNWGTETELNAELLAPGRALGWDMSLGFSTMGNRIDDMGGVSRLLVVALSGMPSRDQYHVEGYPLASLFTPRVLSADFVDGDSGPVTNLMCDGGTGRSGLEVGGSPVPCEEAPDLYWGQVDPTWQVHLSSTWRLGPNLSLTAAVDAQGGHVMNADYLAGQNTRFSEPFVKENDPLFQANERVSRGANVIHDAGFAKLRELTVRYALPPALLQPMGVSRASIRSSMFNVHTLWIQQKYVASGQRIWDPEMHSPNFEYGGIATGSPPPMSHATIQFNVTF